MKFSMNRSIVATAGLLALVFSTPSKALDVTIGLGGEVLPGVYGNVVLSNGVQPRLLYAQPVISRSRIIQFAAIKPHLKP